MTSMFKLGDNKLKRKDLKEKKQTDLPIKTLKEWREEHIRSSDIESVKQEIAVGLVRKFLDSVSKSFSASFCFSLTVSR
jgi:hypothetical protein